MVGLDRHLTGSDRRAIERRQRRPDPKSPEHQGDGGVATACVAMMLRLRRMDRLVHGRALHKACATLGLPDGAGCDSDHAALVFAS